MSVDVKQEYREMVQRQESVHVRRFEDNLAVLLASTIPFTVDSFGLVKIRSAKYPSVDFDPGSNVWVVGNRKTMGDAVQLVECLKRRAL